MFSVVLFCIVFHFFNRDTLFGTVWHRPTHWKGWGHFQVKVPWSVIGYNIRMITGLVVAKGV